MGVKQRKILIPRSKWIPSGFFQQIQKNVPIACVDLLILRKQKSGGLETLFVKRKIYPEKGKWCLIGGRILKGEYTKDTIKRQAREELGVSVKILPPWNEIIPFAVFNDPISDKQKHFVALLYPVIITKGILNTSGPEFSKIKWFSLNKIPLKMGFYHRTALLIISRYAKAKPTRRFQNPFHVFL